MIRDLFSILLFKRQVSSLLSLLKGGIGS